jgi:hypothetical protein
MVRDVPAGEHRLTVNGAGVAPHSEALAVGTGDGPTAAGVDGRIPLVAHDRATKLGVDPRGTDSELTDLAVEDDFAGRLYDAPVDGPDAVYVHRDGAYTAEVRDAEDALGAFRVNPADEDRVDLEEPRTGTASLATYVADVATETSEDVAATVEETDEETTAETPDQTGGPPGETGRVNAVRGLSRALTALAAAAERAAERADAGDRKGTDRSLGAVETALDRVAERLAAAREGLPDDVGRATDRRLDQARRRAEQARESKKL